MIRTPKLGAHPTLYYGLLGPLIGLGLVNLGMISVYVFELITSATLTPSNLIDGMKQLIVINLFGFIVAYLVGFIPAMITGFFAGKADTIKEEIFYAMSIGCLLYLSLAVLLNDNSNPTPLIILSGIGTISGGSCALLRHTFNGLK